MCHDIWTHFPRTSLISDTFAVYHFLFDPFGKKCYNYTLHGPFVFQMSDRGVPRLLEIFFRKNHVLFREDFYVKNQGMTMESNMATRYANIYMNLKTNISIHLFIVNM